MCIKVFKGIQYNCTAIQASHIATYSYTYSWLIIFLLALLGKYFKAADYMHLPFLKFIILHDVATMVIMKAF